MSTVTRPRGPQPPGVYWVRRLLVLVVALLLMLGIGRLLGGGSDGSSGGQQAERVSGQPTTSPTSGSYGPTLPVAPTTPGRKRRGGSSAPASTVSTPQASPTATLPAPSGPCADDDVVVSPVTGTPPAGGDVIVRLDFTTLTSLACFVSVSPDSVALKITRRDGRFVWSTQKCPAALPTQTVVARRDVPGSVNVTWSGHYADSACSDAGAWAVPGWYHAVASVLGGAETDAQWQLGPAAAATVTRTPTPSASATGRATRNPVASPGSQPTARPTGTRSGASEPSR